MIRFLPASPIDESRKTPPFAPSPSKQFPVGMGFFGGSSTTGLSLCDIVAPQRMIPKSKHRFLYRDDWVSRCLTNIVSMKLPPRFSGLAPDSTKGGSVSRRLLKNSECSRVTPWKRWEGAPREWIEILDREATHPAFSRDYAR